MTTKMPTATESEQAAPAPSYGAIMQREADLSPPLLWDVAYFLGQARQRAAEGIGYPARTRTQRGIAIQSGAREAECYVAALVALLSFFGPSPQYEKFVAAARRA